MDDTPTYPGADHDRYKRIDDGSTPRIPRWVKMTALTFGLLILLMVIVMLLIGGEHGPGRHTSSANPVGQDVQHPAGGPATPAGRRG